MRSITLVFLAIISFNLSAQNKGWGVDTSDFVDSSDIINFEAKQGLSIYSGVLVTEEAGFEFNAATFFGKGKVKLGFNLGYVYSHFQDTLKKNAQDEQQVSPFGALGFGFASRIYNKNNQVHITTIANYMISTANSRFKPTNGISLKLAIGVNLNEYLFAQAGVMAQTYLTATNERPTNASFTIGLGVTL